jgi:glutamyl-tRNA(Gln) amidotransferase subunit E
VPLVEPVTYPDMRTPQEAAEVCEILRRLLRTTGKVRTGHGATREDVNVSVRGGTRNEIKGVSSITKIPLLIYNEAMRQWSLLRIREKLEKRGVTPATFAARDYDVTRVLSATQYHPIRHALDNGQEVRCVVLERFAGMLCEQTQTDTAFAKEISDRVRVVACLTMLPNMVHSDAASESLSAEEWKTIRHRVKAGTDDAVVLVWGAKEDAKTACNEVAVRAKEATEGVPRETRQALRDGTTGFERILPGPERMYPDTDLPPVAVRPESVAQARTRLPEPPWEREEACRPLGLPQDIVDALVVSPRYRLFRRAIGEVGVDPLRAGVVIIRLGKWLTRKGLPFSKLSDEEICAVFEAMRGGRIAKEGVAGVLARMVREKGDDGAGISVDETLAALGLTPAGEAEVREFARGLVASASGKTLYNPGSIHRYLMGNMMQVFKGRSDGAVVAGILDEEIRKHRETVHG